MIRLELGEFLAHPFGIGLAPAPLDVADHALEGLLGLVGADAVVIGDGDLVLAGAEEDCVTRLLRKVLPGGVHRELVVLGQGLERLGVVGRGVAGLGPGQDRAVPQRQGGVRHDELRLEFQLGAEPVAFRAGAEGIVEGEEPRLDLVDGEARDRAGEALGEEHALMRLVLGLVGAFLRGGRGGQRLVGEFGHREAVGQLQRRLEGIGQPRCDVGCAPPAGPPPRRCRACTSCRAPEPRRSRGTGRRP